MRKSVSLILSVILAISLAGCSRQKNNTENETNWAEIYQITLESYLGQDSALNENIDFMAIDLSTLEGTNSDDKKEVAIYFEEKYVPVIDTNYDGLKAQGLFDEELGGIANGVLLTIDAVSKTDDEIVIKGMKYRGVLAANWFETTWKLQNGVWEFAGTVMTMIS
jgi:hypothetical protein